jgi:hypothetical protein
MTLSTTDIDQALRRNPLTKSVYKGCFPSNLLPKPRKYPAAMVANFDDSSKPGTHWVALYARTPFHVFYFDSLGLGEETAEEIKRYIRRNFLTSTKQHAIIQKPGTTVCGHYALFFLYCCIRHIPFLQIEAVLTTRKNPDVWVRNFVRNVIMK